jgi:hypothetical protein
MEDKSLAVQESRSTYLEEYAMPAERILAQVDMIQHVMKSVMKEGLDAHYAVIPGTKKPSLLKAGAEKLSMTFRLLPSFDVTIIDLANDHREVRITCTLNHAVTGQFMGQGVGSCSTLESKYRYRQAERTCPQCGSETIIKGKAEYGGGWLCFAKRGGCGAKFNDDDPAITQQNAGKTENPDIADTYNTVLKIAKKRAHVDAIITATGASDIFTQDTEDMAENGTIKAPPESKPGTAKPPITQPSAKKTNGETLTVRGAIDEIKTFDGKTKAGKDYTKWGIVIADNSYGTFDSKIGELAGQYVKCEVVLSYTTDGKFNTIVELVPVLQGEAA